MLPVLPENRTWAIGGGTILAAQWQHRKSTDIDLKVPKSTGLTGLRPEYNPDFERQMKQQGAKEITPLTDQIIIDFHTGKIDIFQSRPTPAVGAYKANVENHAEIILGNAQILAGKLLGRALASPTRDLFDLAVAQRDDTTALEVAVNCMSQSLFKETISRWREGADFYRHDATRALLGVPNQFKDIQEDPAGAATEALLEARYSDLTIHWREEQLIVTTSCTSREPRAFAIESGDIDGTRSALERTGVNEYLKASPGVDPEIILDRIKRTRGAGITTVYDAAREPRPGRTPPNPTTPPAAAGATELTRTKSRSQSR